MAFRNLLFAGAAIAALNCANAAIADDADMQTRQLNTQQLEKAQATQAPQSQLNTIRQPLAQVGPDGMPATSEDKARREPTPRDMAPDTGYQSAAPSMDHQRVAQSEKPGDQHMTTPLPPTTGTEAKAVTLSQVDQPDKTLVNAPVESKDGRKIGEVAQVTLDANGKAREVVLNDRNGTRLAAGELVFQPDRGVLITQLSPSDLAPSRGAKPESASPRSTSPTGGPPNAASEDQGPPEQPPPEMPDTRPGNNGY